MLAHSIINEPIVLESDSRSEDVDDNLNTTHALCTLDSEQLGRDALDLDILPMPFNRSADKLEDSNNDDSSNDIDNNTSLYPVKRQRSASPRCELINLPHASTPPLPYNEDVEGSTKNAYSSDSDESEDDNFLSKRQKISDSLGGRTALSSHDGRS